MSTISDFGNRLSGLNLGRKLIALVVGVCILSTISSIIFYVGWVTVVDNYQIAYEYRLWPTGANNINVLVDSKGEYERGWIIRTPIIVKVHTVDLRPMQITMNANSRVLNAKLVQFNPEGLELFLSWHGRKDYEGPGGVNNITTSFSEILKSYAYDGNTYPFLTVLRDLKAEKTDDPVALKTGELKK